MRCRFSALLAARPSVGDWVVGVVGAGYAALVTATLAAPNAVILDAGSRPATRVRFCWGDSPACMLSDASRLPAGPFELPVH